MQEYSLTFVHNLGEGQFSEVVLVENAVGEKFAQKKLKGTFCDRNYNQGASSSEASSYRKTVITNFEREAAILEKLAKHSHIANYVVSQISILCPQMSFILLEYYPRGSLDKYLQNYGLSIPIQQKLTWSEQIAKGMAHVHQHGIIHADIATRNVFLDENLNAKLGDFGLARRVAQDQLIASEDVPTFWYPKEFFFPREQNEKHMLTFKLDIYSYGVTLWEIVSNDPEPGKKLRELLVCKTHDNINLFLEGIKKGEGIDPVPEGAPCVLKDVITQCRNENPDFRPSAEEIVETLTSAAHEDEEDKNFEYLVMFAVPIEETPDSTPSNYLLIPKENRSSTAIPSIGTNSATFFHRRAHSSMDIEQQESFSVSEDNYEMHKAI